MAFISIPTTLTAGNSVSSEHIMNIYSSLTSGSYDVNLNQISTNNAIITNSSDFNRCCLTLCDNIVSTKVLPTTNLNSIMESYGLSAISENEGKVCIAKWSYNNVYYTMLTACMKIGTNTYKWVYNSNLLR